MDCVTLHAAIVATGYSGDVVNDETCLAMKARRGGDSTAAAADRFQDFVRRLPFLKTLLNQAAATTDHQPNVRTEVAQQFSQYDCDEGGAKDSEDLNQRLSNV